MSKPAIQHCLELLSRLSLRSQYRLGDVFAFLLRCFPNQVSRQARENLKLCFPDLPADKRDYLYRESIRHTCYTMTELGAIWCWPHERVLEKITSSDICAEFEESGSKIILTPHLGSWETFVIWVGHYQQAMTLYKRPHRKHLDGFIKTARTRAGGTLVPAKKRGLRKLLQGLKNGENVMILPDQKPGRNKARIESRFFGFDAPTTRLVHALCSKVDCSVFIATILRSNPVGEFHLEIKTLDHAELSADDIASARYMNDQIEQVCRKHLEQYQWGYRRFANKAYNAAKQG
ncbi:MAG: lysophospholipid acyltransferase family protein [Pseudomonadota bacterium]